MNEPAAHSVQKAVDSIQKSLTDYACGLNYEGLSPEAIHAAKVRVIDTLGALILAEFAIGLQYDNIPSAVIDCAKDCFIDAVAVCASLSMLDSNKSIIDYATHYGKGGNSVILGTSHRVHAPHAAFANGAIGASFEMDSVFQPGVGAHPGVSLTAPGLAIAHEMGVGGKE